MKIEDKYLYKLSHYFHGNIFEMEKSLLKNKLLNLDNLKFPDFNYLTFNSSYYPYEYQEINLKPMVLYYQGNLNLLKYLNKIAIIGSRQNSNFGKLSCEKLISELAKSNFLTVIVSGLAKGIDLLSHKYAIKYKLPTIAIISYSFNHLKKASLEIQNLAKEILDNNGLIITEYPNTNYQVLKSHFKIRNRLISGICQKLIIIEAKNNSGTMNTAKHALDQNKDIFCLPNPPFSNSGCNKLIKEGANLFDNINDLL